MPANSCEICKTNPVKGRKKQCDECRPMLVSDHGEGEDYRTTDGPVLQALERLEIKMDQRFTDLEISLTDTFKSMVDKQIQLVKVEMSKDIDECQKVTQLENRSVAIEACKQTIVIKNMTVTQAENVISKVNSTIKDSLKLRDVEIERAERKESYLEGRHGHILVKLKSIDNVKSVMKNKAKLKDRANYRNVYFEPDRSKEERQNLSNLRTIMNTVGRDKLELRGSRLNKKQYDLQDGGRGQHRPSGQENDTHLSSDNRNNAIPAGQH